MRKKIAAACCLATVLSTTAWAADYTFEGPDGGLFARPTSDETIYVDQKEVNVDRSKNTALVPPAFGSATAYLPGSGEALTPNLVGGGSVIPGSGSAGGTVVTPPTISGSTDISHNPGGVVSGSGGSFTIVTPELYYSAGHIGTLKIPSIGLNVKVYQGTDDDALRYGVGHFEQTSIWNGNVAIAGHNRGVNSYFGQIHNLKMGAKIQLTTKIGTKEYEVASVAKIAATDLSVLNARDNDIITLITCVKNQPDYRWCVQARAVR